MLERLGIGCYTFSDFIVYTIYRICCIAPNADNLVKIIIDSDATTVEQILKLKDVQSNEIWIYILCLICMDLETRMTCVVQSKNIRVFKKLTTLNTSFDGHTKRFIVKKAIEAGNIDMVKHCIVLWPNVLQKLFDKIDWEMIRQNKKSQYISVDLNDEMNHVILNALNSNTIEDEFEVACHNNDICTMKIILNGHIDINDVDDIVNDFSDIGQANYTVFKNQNTLNTDV